MSVLKVFSLIYGSLPMGWDASCMSNQLAFLDTLPLYDKNTLFASTCATPITAQSSSLQQLAVVRPIKVDGPSPDPNAPLRIDPNASPATPMSVAQDPGDGGDSSTETSRNKNTAPSQLHSTWKRNGFWLLCMTILLTSWT